MLLKSILVPIDLGDPSDAALAYAVDIAESVGAGVTVLYAFELPMVGFPDGVAVAGAELATRITIAGQEALDRALARHRSRKVAMTPLLKQGDPREMIIATAAEIGADLIVMGTHGRRGAARALVGSVTERIVRTSPIPVLTLRAVAAAA